MLDREQPCTPPALVAAFISAVGYQFSHQFAAQFHRTGLISALRYVDEIEHPWPRAFKFNLELFVDDGATAGEIYQAYQQHSGGADAECVVDLLVPDPAPLSAESRQFGFVPAFQKDLMAREIQPLTGSAPAAGLRVRHLDSIDLVERSAIFGTEYQSDRRFIHDECIRDFVALDGDALVATAQIVATDLGVAYVSRMFTVPEFRQRGACRALLDEIHAYAHALGMTHAVLVPSLMAREHRVYERLGYQACVPISLLIRDRA